MSTIHIKKSHEGRFTAYKKRTGKTGAGGLSISFLFTKKSLQLDKPTIASDFAN